MPKFPDSPLDPFGVLAINRSLEQIENGSMDFATYRNLRRLIRVNYGSQAEFIIVDAYRRHATKGEK